MSKEQLMNEMKAPTTVNLTLNQKFILQKYNFNLSEWIRDTLDENTISNLAQEGKYVKGKSN